MEHSVLVAGSPHRVVVLRKAKSVWIATGEYMNKRLGVQAGSAESVLGAWRRAAEYRLVMIADAGIDRSECVIASARASHQSAMQATAYVLNSGPNGSLGDILALAPSLRLRP